MRSVCVCVCVNIFVQYIYCSPNGKTDIDLFTIINNNKVLINDCFCNTGIKTSDQWYRPIKNSQ